ncbi:acetyl-CoA carboxylase biotin carboxyl carrier protein [soil metagenome]
MATNHEQQTTGAPDDEMGQIRELTSVVENLISIMVAGNIGSLKLEYGSLRLALQSKDRAVKPSRAKDNDATSAVVKTDSDQIENPSTAHVVAAPMIGTFYVASAPNEPPFVFPGDVIAEGQTIGIIEAMKIMNEIASDCAGTVLEVIASDGQTVEYGSALVRVEPSDE